MHTCKYLSFVSFRRPSWSWWYGSWIYNELCNQSLSPLVLWVRSRWWRGVLDTTLCDAVCQWLAAGQWFSSCISVSSSNEKDRHDITEILLKVALNTMTQPHNDGPSNHILQTSNASQIWRSWIYHLYYLV